MSLKTISILGSTGSIGSNTVDIINKNRTKFSTYSLSSKNNVSLLSKQSFLLKPKIVAIQNKEKYKVLKNNLFGKKIKVVAGDEGVIECTNKKVDISVASIVGIAGLKPTLNSIKNSSKLCLANKECLVTAGSFFMKQIFKSKCKLLPLDSEHNAIFQCMPADKVRDPHGAGITRILLTASGGPFRESAAEDLRAVTPAQACAHPNWSMGQKISVDSATLMNKGLELIEACWLFNTTPANVQVHVHPESIIHSMVEYADGSVLAQLGSPDMRTPIANGLAWPERIEAGVAPLDLFAIGRFHFERPDLQRFPCLRLAREAAEAGGVASAVLNAANEVAVEAFLAESLPFTAIPRVLESVMECFENVEPTSLDDVKAADRLARERAAALIPGYKRG